VNFIEELGNERMTAIIRADDERKAAGAMEAAIRGGFRIVEFTLTTPGAIDLIAEFSRKPEVIVGAGTVLEGEQVRAAVRAGARFLVSPVVDEIVIGLANEMGVAI
jgi:2-dehydro-3-deoxyphosphogluconate aldolase/(4S)-4-hydroxy-2-oxoglutarate aldolase